MVKTKYEMAFFSFEIKENIIFVKKYLEE